MDQSIFRASLRSFFVALFKMCGYTLGFVFMILTLALLASKTDEDLEVKSKYTTVLETNAKDVRKALTKSSPVILKININGFIGTPLFNMYTVKDQLVESREGALKDDRVKAILLHINTPGGTVTDADGIYRALMAYKDQYKVPVYAYVDGLCASGGMYIASAADKIYASETSLIGSVGVITSPFFNVTNLMEKIGIESKTLFAGKGKEDLNPFRTWKKGEEDSTKAVIEYLYKHFVKVVASSRTQMSEKSLIDIYGANVFPTTQAVEFGFIDGSVNSLNDTLQLLVSDLGFKDDNYQVLKMERKFALSSFLSEDSNLMRGTIKHKMELPGGLPLSLSDQFLYLYYPSH